MGYSHCETHDQDATNGCEACGLEGARAFILKLFEPDFPSLDGLQLLQRFRAQDGEYDYVSLNAIFEEQLRLAGARTVCEFIRECFYGYQNPVGQRLQGLGQLVLKETF